LECKVHFDDLENTKIYILRKWDIKLLINQRQLVVRVNDNNEERSTNPFQSNPKMLIRIKCTHYADLSKQRVSHIYLPLKPLYCGFNVFLSGPFYLENSEWGGFTLKPFNEIE